MPPAGPFLWENWQHHRAGHPVHETLEHAFHSDAALGPPRRIRFGPYDAFVLQRSTGSGSPALVLREPRASPPTVAGPKLDRTDTDRFHGGWLEDEAAALLSLCLRVRVVPGATIRRSYPRDPEGWPIHEDARGVPRFRGGGAWVRVRRALRADPADDPGLLTRFGELDARDAVAVVRAARLYQQGLAVAEIDPNLCWLMLVSALETGAAHWSRETPVDGEQLRSWNGKLADLLEAAGGPELVEAAAALMANQLGATAKFRKFTMHFMPAPPAERPAPEHQLSWEPKALRRAVERVYGYRSRALHAGTPFPSPMSEAHAPDSPPPEVEPGLAVGSHNATWTRDDLPMMLHVFEHIAQGALVGWWRSLLPAEGTERA